MIVLMSSVIRICSWGYRSGLIYCILHLVRTQRDLNMLLVLFVLHWKYVKMHSIVLRISVRAPRDCGFGIGLCIKYLYSLGTDFFGGGLSVF